MREIRESLSTMGDGSAFVTSRLFGDTADACMKRVVALEEFVVKTLGLPRGRRTP